MISLINGIIQSANAALITPLGYLELTLNVDATVIAAPFGQVMAGIPIKIYFDASCNVITTGGVNQIWSNLELNPQQSPSLLGTWYTVNFYDANNCRVNQNPLTWIFPNAAGSTVDIGGMVATNVPGIVYYPVLGSGGGLTGSGTTNRVTKWTGASALGNSSITDDGTNVSTTEPVAITTSSATNSLNVLATPASCSAASSPSFINTPTAYAAIASLQYASATNAVIASGYFPTVGGSTGAPAITGVYGYANPSSTVTNTESFIAGTVGRGRASSTLAAATIPNVSGLYGLADIAYSNGTVTWATGVYGFVNVASAANIVTSSAAFYAASPTITNPGVTQNNYGLYIADQTVGGANNPNPFGIFEAGTAPNQLGGSLKVTNTIQTTAVTFATLPAASGALEGCMRAVTDSTTNIWGATITGGGANRVLAYCNGTNWTVMAK